MVITYTALEGKVRSVCISLPYDLKQRRRMLSRVPHGALQRTLRGIASASRGQDRNPSLSATAKVRFKRSSCLHGRGRLRSCACLDSRGHQPYKRPSQPHPPTHEHVASGRNGHSAGHRAHQRNYNHHRFSRGLRIT